MKTAASQGDSDAPRSEKRRRVGRGRVATQPHPLGIKPHANLLVSSPALAEAALAQRRSGLAVLPDELVLCILRALPPAALLSFGAASRVSLAFADADELWEILTYDCGVARPRRAAPLPQVALFSDVLYYSWLYLHVDLTPFLGDNMERRSILELSESEFFETYARGNRPVILLDVAPTWPALQYWTLERLTPHYRRLMAGLKPREKLACKFDRFFTHMFHFAKQPPHHSVEAFFGDDGAPRPVQLSDYEIPKYFRDDIFAVLGEERPQQFRWLLLGAARSGSCFHQDPHFTSAWNTSIVGRKKFVMIPGDQVPPGVEALGGDDFRAPQVVLQWFVEHYHELAPDSFYEAVVHPGECIYVPSGWWHTVLNLDDTIAVTQNFVDLSNLVNVVDYLRYSDCALHDKFVAALKEKRPELLDLLKPAKSEWDALVEGDEDGATFTLFSS